MRTVGDRRVELRTSSIVRGGVRRDVVRKASNQQSGQPRLRLSSHGERERHNADGHNFGVIIFQLCSVSSSLSHANFEQPFRNLQIKWEVNILLKKSSCVFLCASFITASLSSCVCLLLCRYDAAWCCRWLYNIYIYIYIWLNIIVFCLHIFRNIQPKPNRINFEISANVLKCL